jgi:hypothetical protein
MKFWQMIALIFLLAPAVALPYEGLGAWQHLPALLLGLVLGTMVEYDYD